MGKLKQYFLGYTERFGPLGVGVFILLFTLFNTSNQQLRSIIVLSESSVLSISLTLGGFLLTVYTIIYAVDNRYTKALKSTGDYHLLTWYLNLAVRANFATVFLALFVLMYGSSTINLPNLILDYKRYLACLYLGFITYTIGLNVRIVYIITKYLSYDKKN